MKSERTDLPLTIARLVRSAAPVTPLDAPSVRLARWIVASATLVLLGVVLLGVRPDAAAQMVDGWFVARAAATTAIALAAAGVALLLSVPGVEPSRGGRALPLLACLVWAAMLVIGIAATSSPFELLLQVAPHPSCVLFIAATGLSPGVVLVRMLRHAAPLRTAWTAGCAGLASLAVGALGAQFVCTNDAAAHHLLWHFAPVLLLSVASVAVGSSWLGGRYRHGPRPA